MPRLVTCPIFINAWVAHSRIALLEELQIRSGLPLSDLYRPVAYCIISVMIRSNTWLSMTSFEHVKILPRMKQS